MAYQYHPDPDDDEPDAFLPEVAQGSVTIGGVTLPPGALQELRRLGFAISSYTPHQLFAIANATRIDRSVVADRHADPRNIYDLIDYSPEEEALDHALEDDHAHAPNLGYTLCGIRPVCVAPIGLAAAQWSAEKLYGKPVAHTLATTA